MKVYAIPGLGADERVFDKLTLGTDLVVLKWIEPLKGEGIVEYSDRFMSHYKLNEVQDLTLLGLSFGGLIATEISKILDPHLTILISSAETGKELKTLFKLIGSSHLHKLIPFQAYKAPKFLTRFMFGTQEKEMLNAILDDTDPKFTKWAVNQIINWSNVTKIKNVYKIHGSKDRLIPPKDPSAHIVDDGGHFMIVDKAEEVSGILNEVLLTRI